VATAIRPPWGVVRRVLVCKVRTFNLVEQCANVVGEPVGQSCWNYDAGRGEGKSGVIPAGRSIGDRHHAKAGREHEFL